jgi:GntR family transcriptional regulator of vanillate catabolism
LSKAEGTEGVSGSNRAAEADSHIERTVMRLRELVLTGEFGPGKRISEAPLTVRLGVSRTPIRLALERLAHEGLLEPYPTGGFIVRKFTLNDIWDVIEIRGMLEGGAAGQMTRNSIRYVSRKAIWTRWANRHRTNFQNF